MQVSIHEFRTHLSRYLSEVRAGKVLEVTAYRRVVARVSAVPETPVTGIPNLLAAGAAQWRGGKPVGARIQLSADGAAVSRMVLEDRG